MEGKLTQASTAAREARLCWGGVGAPARSVGSVGAMGRWGGELNQSGRYSRRARRCVGSLAAVTRKSLRFRFSFWREQSIDS
jgi:hypothetical protein